MNKILITTLLLGSTLLADNSNVYVEMSPTWIKYEAKDVNYNFKPTGFKWTAGYEVKDFTLASVAIEGSAMIGVENDTTSTASTMIDEIYSLHLKGSFPLTEGLSANIYAGGTRGKMLLTSNQVTASSNFENSFSYGAGAEYWFKSDVSLHADYMKYFKNIDAIEVGIGFRF